MTTITEMVLSTNVCTHQTAQLQRSWLKTTGGCTGKVICNTVATVFVTWDDIVIVRTM